MKIRFVTTLFLITVALNSYSADLTRVTLYSPVDGDLVYSSKDDTLLYRWAFNMWGPNATASDQNTHKRRADGTGYGILRTDDYFAIDANINAGVPAGKDLDNLLPVYPVADGTVVGWFGVSESNGLLKAYSGYDGSPNYGAVLVKHTINSQTFYSGYMHMTPPAKSSLPAIGSPVTKSTILGYVSKAGGVSNNHLHFAVYDSASLSVSAAQIQTGKATTINYLKAINYTSYVATSGHQGYRVITKPATASYTLKLNQSITIPLQGYYGSNSVNFNATSAEIPWYNSYAWYSDNKLKVTVDGSGKIVAKAVGSANITLYYSGLKQTFTVTVTN